MADTGDGDIDELNFDDFLKNRDLSDDDDMDELDKLLDESDDGQTEDAEEEVVSGVLLPMETEVEEKQEIEPKVPEKKVEEKTVTKEKPTKKNRFVIEFERPKPSEVDKMKEEDQKFDNSLLLFIKGKLEEALKSKTKKKVEEEEEAPPTTEVQVEHKEVTLNKGDEEIISKKLHSINQSLLEKYQGQVVPTADTEKLLKHYKTIERNKNFFDLHLPIQKEIVLLEFIHQHLNEKFYRYVMKSNRYRKQRDAMKKMVKERDMEIQRLKKKEKLLRTYEARIKELDKNFVPSETSKKDSSTASKLFGFFGV